MKEVMLDSDIISFFLRGDKKVSENLLKYLKKNDYVNISVITYYEILNGLLYKDAKRQLGRFNDFISYNKVIPLTYKSAEISARIFSVLRSNGKTIGHNDVLISGIAIEHNFTLITNNVKDFSKIPDVVIKNWKK